MAKRYIITGNSFIKEDTGSGAIEIDKPSKDIYFNNEALNKGFVLIIQKDGSSGIYSAIGGQVALADAVNSKNVVFIESTFRAFMQSKTGGVGGAVDVVLQDGTSPLMMVHSSKIIVETTTSVIVAKNDYVVSVVSATGFLVGQYLTIYNEEANRVYFSRVLAINTLAITLDRPIDFEFAVGSFVSVADTNMAVDGSVTPQIFGIRNPTGVDIPLAFDITRLMLMCLADTAVDLSKFGDIIGGLTRGIVARRVDGTFRNIFNAKTNGEMANLMFDFNILSSSNPSQGQDGFTGRLTFAGQNKMGAVIRIGSDEDLQIIIQDDLTSLASFEIIAEGSEVTD